MVALLTLVAVLGLQVMTQLCNATASDTSTHQMSVQCDPLLWRPCVSITAPAVGTAMQLCSHDHAVSFNYTPCTASLGSRYP
jgi:hypothetical protein